MTRLLLVALVALAACAPVYVPNVRNSPMFTKGREFQACVQIGNGLEAQSAFAVTDHFGLMTNFSFIDQTGVQEDRDFHRHQLFEAGLGYFTNKDDSFFEVFAGYGRGKGTSLDSFELFGSQSAVATGRYDRYFLQPAFGVNKNEFNFSFAPRVSMVDFYEFSTETISITIEEEPVFFFEPAIIGRANFANNHMFAVFQAGVSLGMSEDVYFDRRTFQLSGGLGLRLGGAKRILNRL